MQCCWFSSSFQGVLWWTARRHCRNVNDCLGSSIVLLRSIKLLGKSALRCLREKMEFMSAVGWNKQDDGRDGWGEEGSTQGINKNMGEWHLPEKKKFEVNEGGQYTNGRGWRVRLEGEKTSGNVRPQREGRKRQRENQLENMRIFKEEEIVPDQGACMGNRLHERKILECMSGKE